MINLLILQYLHYIVNIYLMISVPGFYMFYNEQEYI